MKERFGWLLTIVSLFVFLTGISCQFVMEYSFSKNCKDYLKLGADAPKVEMAERFLSQAIKFIEEKGMTEGNSAFLLKTPKNDLGFWYGQIKGARETLQNLLQKKAENPKAVTQLEQDNALMKIREVLLDESNSETTVTLPKNIAIFPYQLIFLFLVGVIPLVGTLIGAFFIFQD